MTLCDCNGRRIPDRWKVTFSGVTNGSCMDCESMNGDYFIDRVGSSCTRYRLDIMDHVCGITWIEVHLTDQGDGLFKLEVLVELIGTYEIEHVPDLLAGPIVAELDSGTPLCNFPPTLTITALGPSNMGELVTATCIAPFHLLLMPPFEGIPDPANVCPGFSVPTPRNPNGTPGMPPGMGNPKPPGTSPPRIPGMGDPMPPGASTEAEGYSFCVDPKAQSNPPGRTFCPSCPSCQSSNPSDGPEIELPAGDTPPAECTLEQASNAIPQMVAAPAPVDLSTGAVQYQLAPPQRGALDPDPVFTFNSRYASVTENGRGVTGSYNSRLTEMDASTVELISASGDSMRYTNKDVSGKYIAPTGGGALVKHVDNTWTETKLNRNAIHYGTDGKVDYVASPTGTRWTVSYDGGGKIENIQNPVGALTTFGYDGNDKLQSVTDGGGRVTTFTVDGSDNLTSITTPEGCITEMAYDVSNRLRTYVDPLGNRTTYSYNGDGLVSTVELPTGDRTTISWLDWSTTAVKDARGNTQTLTYNAARNITRIENPFGQRTTLTWNLDQLTSFQDATNNVTALSYQRLSDRVEHLVSVTNPSSKSFAYAYDASNRVETLINPLGVRTTFVWNGDSQRSATVDPLGFPNHVFVQRRRPGRKV